MRQDPARTQISENVDLPRLVDLCAQRLGLNIQYDPNVLKGALTLRLGAGVTDQELWALTNRLLAARELTTIQMPGESTLTVTPLSRAGSLARLEATDLSGAVAGYVKVLRDLQYVDSEDVIPALVQVMSGSGALASALGTTRSLMLGDLRPHLEQAFQLLELLDVPPGETVVEEIAARVLQPAQLIAFAKELAAARSSITGEKWKGQLLESVSEGNVLLVAPAEEVPFWRALLSQLDRGEIFETRAYTSPNFGLPEVSKLIEDIVHGTAAGTSDRWRVVTDDLTGTLVITARASDHSRIEALMERLALVPPEEALIEEIPVVNVSPTALVSLVEQVASTRSTVTGRPLKGKLIASPAGEGVLLIAPPDEAEFWRDVIERMDRREEVLTQTYTPRNFPLSEVSSLVEEIARGPRTGAAGERWKLVADELTRTLILTATPSQHQMVAELIERLDNSAPTSTRRVRAFTVRNRSATELVDVLNRLIGVGALSLNNAPGPSAQDDLQTSTRDFGPPTRALASDSGEAQDPLAVQTPATAGGGGDLDLNLTADSTTNTLIATGEVAMLDQLEALIGTLDVRQPQVMLEVLVVNLSESDAFDLSVEFLARTDRGTSVNLASLFGTGTPGLDESGDLPGLTGLTGLVLNPGDYSILVNALQSLNQGRTLNIPKVLVNSNETAELDSVLQTPFTSTNASNTVATTSFGGTQDAGMTISVRPQIAEGDHLLLDYTVTLSTFTGESSDPALPPPRQQNSLKSIVTIPDGYAVALGGLITETEAEATSQVPLLGDLPIVGALFRSRSKSTQRTRFYVFIRATVLRHENFEDLRYLSEMDLEAAAVDDGWPDVLPRLIR